VSSDYDAVLYARADCADAGTEIACNDVSTPGGGDTVSFQVSPGIPYTLFVDGYGGEHGNFTLDVIVYTAFCGNGVAEAPEGCDDGNTADGDGCSASCAVEPGGIPDDCPGQAFFLTGPAGAPRMLSLLGDTTNYLAGNSPLSCTGTGKQAIYAVTTDVDGAMQVDLQATYDAATLYVRGECDTAATQLDCIEAADPDQTIGVSVPVLANTTYYIFADSQSSIYNGPFSLEVTITPASCGNDVLDGGEQCDDGNGATGDGCSPSCFLEPPGGANDVCPGAALPLGGAPLHGVVTATTATLVGDYVSLGTATCAKIVGARDAVYSVTAPINGLLTATVDGEFDAAIYARSVCVTSNLVDQIGCVEKVDGGGPETISFPVIAGTTYYLFVDGALAGDYGVFELSVDVTPGACGNGVLEGGEQCDDGNTTGGDGCGPSCALEPPGPKDACPGEVLALAPQGGSYVASAASGTLNLLNDVALTGCPSPGRDAIYQVVAPIDGVLTASVPAAAFNVSLGARADCATAASQLTCADVSAGDGGEQVTFAVAQGQDYFLIVDGTMTTEFGTFQLDVLIEPPGCGDNLVSAGEQCDDGNTAAGDGCGAGCLIEPLPDNDVCPGHAVQLTGAGSEPRVGVVSTDTTPLLANYSGGCGGSAREAVYVVTPDVAGTLTAELVGGYNSVLYARSSCADAATETACDDTASPSGSRDISFPVLASTSYYLFVDGFSGAFGASTLHVTVTP
jgi:cysteine-rich repeat protein